MSTRRRENQGAAVAELRNRRLADHGNAQRLIDQHGNDLRYLPGAGWYAWDGTRWLLDSSGEIVRRARDLVDHLYAEADRVAAKHGDTDERAKALRQHAKASASRRGIEAMIALARSDQRVVLDNADVLDADPYLLNAPNGTIDLRTGELRPHDRADLITRRVAVDYDPEAKAPTWDAFLTTVLPGEGLRRYAQRTAGQAAVGTNEDELLHVHWGPGANGKTKYGETITTALGDYAATRAADLFLAGRRSGPAPELVSLRGVRLLAASETEQDRRLSTALVKVLTGGDTVAARLLYVNEVVEFVPVFSPWLRTNHRPAIRDQSEAAWRRVRLVPFTVTIPKTSGTPIFKTG